jgi:hypothetical protein
MLNPEHHHRTSDIPARDKSAGFSNASPEMDFRRRISIQMMQMSISWQILPKSCERGRTIKN